MNWKISLAVALSFVLGACSPVQWQVKDAQGQVQSLSNPRFAPQDEVRMRVGEGFRNLEASELVELQRLDSLPRKILEGQVWQAFRVKLADGSEFPEAWLNAEILLAGNMGRHEVGLPLSALQSFGASLSASADSAHAATNDTTKTNAAPTDSAKTTPPAEPAKE